MLKDRILAATIAGMAAAILKTIPNIILWKMGIVQHLYIHVAASALIQPKDVNTVWGLMLGIIVDIITGGTLGILIMYLFKFTGRDYWWYKGLIIGNVIWLWGLGIAINFGASRIVPLDPVFRLTSLLEHQIFGVVGAYLIIRWYPETESKAEKPEMKFIRRLISVPARKPEPKGKMVRPVKPKKL